MTNLTPTSITRIEEGFGALGAMKVYIKTTSKLVKTSKESLAKACQYIPILLFAMSGVHRFLANKSFSFPRSWTENYLYHRSMIKKFPAYKRMVAHRSFILNGKRFIILNSKERELFRKVRLKFQGVEVIPRFVQPGCYANRHELSYKNRHFYTEFYTRGSPLAVSLTTYLKLIS